MFQLIFTFLPYKVGDEKIDLGKSAAFLPRTCLTAF
jgi:hypothetical protein